MEDPRVKQLLDKYWDGTTTLAEESDLRSYFASEQVSPAFDSFRPLFQFFSEEGTVQMGDIAPPEAKNEIGQTRVRSMRWLMHAAAAVLFLFGLFFIGKKSVSTQPDLYAYEDTYENPELAYAEFKRAMYLVSSKMNKGMTAATSTLQKMQPLDNILN